MPRDRERWKRILLALVALNLAGGALFLVTQAVVPSWIVYPIFLAIGVVRLVRGDGTTGIVFLCVTALVFVVVHFPFTRYGPSGSACQEEVDCHTGIAWATLTVLPVALLLAGGFAWWAVRPETRRLT